MASSSGGAYGRVPCWRGGEQSWRLCPVCTGAARAAALNQQRLPVQCRRQLKPCLKEPHASFQHRHARLQLLTRLLCLLPAVSGCQAKKRVMKAYTGLYVCVCGWVGGWGWGWGGVEGGGGGGDLPGRGG